MGFVIILGGRPHGEDGPPFGFAAIFRGCRSKSFAAEFPLWINLCHRLPRILRQYGWRFPKVQLQFRSGTCANLRRSA